jgi:hypothetical protein
MINGREEENKNIAINLSSDSSDDGIDDDEANGDVGSDDEAGLNLGNQIDKN